MRNIAYLFAVMLLLMSASVHAKTVVVLMDGTWNEPEFEENGKFPQGNATNVEKLHKLLLREGQSVHYFRGIGTDGKRFEKVVDGAFGKTAEQRVHEAMQEIARVYQAGDDIVLFGFSRGAATSRMLARRIRAEGLNGAQPTIRFMGLWDTVASLGVPAPKLGEFRKQFHDAEERLRIPDNVKHVVHLVAIDENRSLFEPTRVSLVDSRKTTVDELWFAGNHGDVGGGWEKSNPSERQLSDITLVYMIRKAASFGVKFSDSWESKVLEPNDGTGLVHKLTLKDPTVLGGTLERQLESAGSDRPRVYHSVKLKYDNDTTYRPGQLTNGFERVEVVH